MTRRQLSRRGFLGAAAGAAVVAGGGLLGASGTAGAAATGSAATAGAGAGAADVAPNYFMKWGAVCSPPGDFATKVDILRRMAPSTVRVSTYWGNPDVPQFSFGQLDQLRSTGLTEMILQSSENPDPALAYRQLDQLLPYVDANPHTLFVWEIGNEPDHHEPTNPGSARWKRLVTLRDNKPRQSRPNLFWAVNMPAGRWDVPGGSGGFFHEFVRDHGDGLGSLLTGHLRPDITTVHCYAHDRLCPGGGEENPFKMVDYVRGWNADMPLKITEAGINARLADRGHRYVEFGATLAAYTGARADSICFYGLPHLGDGPNYELSHADADQIASRARTYLC